MLNQVVSKALTQPGRRTAGPQQHHYDLKVSLHDDSGHLQQTLKKKLGEARQIRTTGAGDGYADVRKSGNILES